MDNKKIPYKIYLNEDEMPKQWYNVRADMKNKPAPLLNPATGKPVTLEELSHVFCTELAKQELDDTTAYFDIPEEILQFYKMYRPAPLVRAYHLERALQTPAKIYYKFEGIFVCCAAGTGVTSTCAARTNCPDETACPHILLIVIVTANAKPHTNPLL